MKKCPWQNYVLAAILAAGVLFLLFQFRIHLGNLAISLKPLLAGCAWGAAVSGVSLGLKRKSLPAIGAAVFFLTWFLIPGGSVFASILCGCAFVCLLGGIPFYAALLERISG